MSLLDLDWSIIVFGLVGGALPDALRLIKNRYKSKLPKYLRRPQFWMGFVLLIILGGVAAIALGAQSAKDALIYGFAAPELISRLAAGITEAPPDRGEYEGRSVILDWWSS